MEERVGQTKKVPFVLEAILFVQFPLFAVFVSMLKFG